MKLPSRIACAALVLCVSAAAHADARVRHLAYDADRVTELNFCVGFQTTIGFAVGETIENVAVGDSSGFQAIASKRADMLFVKPTSATAQTNMTVVTSRRLYNFLLRVLPGARCPAAQTAFSVSFNYPPEPKPAVPPEPPRPALAATPATPIKPQAAIRINTAYSFTGDPGNVPLRVHDDGRETFFRWPEGVPTPAIYAVDPNGSRSIINYAQVGDEFAVDRVAVQFELRRGKSVTELYNDGYQPPALDQHSPQVRATDSKGKWSPFWPFRGKESGR